MRGWCLAAQVAGTKGLDGKLRLVNASAFLRFPAQVQTAFVPPRIDTPRFSEVLNVEPTAEDECIVQFSEVTTIDVAQQLVGCSVLAFGNTPDTSKPAERTFVGFNVIDPAASFSGSVSYIDFNRAQPLMCVAVPCGSELRDVFIPFVEGIVTSIDEAAKVITVSLPAGILEL